MEIELHPEIAQQEGFVQTVQQHEVHPALMADEPRVSQQYIEPVAAPEQEVEAAPEQEQPVPVVQESPKDRQWRELKASAEQAKREKEQLAREIEIYKDLVAQQKAQEHNHEDDYDTVSERKINERLKAVEARAAQAEKEAQEARRQAAVSRGEQRLLEDYPDIREVVSDANIKRLQDEYPHLYNSVISSNDVYTVGAAAHEMIVAKGIYRKPAMQANNSIVNRNLAKPKSASSIAPTSGETPISRAQNFMGASISSEDERRAIWKEMQESAFKRF